MTEESPLFLRLRIVVFNCVNFFSFLWVILDSSVIFSQWDYMKKNERSLVSVMLIVNVITVVMLLFLLLLQFRVWLDVARISLLLVAQIGSASAFAYWKPQFNCEENPGDEEGICDLFTICVLVTSWIVPALLLLYLVGLAYRSYRHRVERFSTAGDTESSNTLPTLVYPKKTHLWTVYPAPVTFPPEACNGRFVGVDSRRITISTTRSKAPSFLTGPPTPSTPGRLNKRSPSSYYL